MPAFAAGFAALLEGVDRPGDFCTSGTTELLAPALRVDGVGEVRPVTAGYRLTLIYNLIRRGKG
jgi:hypothetical protein